MQDKGGAFSIWFELPSNGYAIPSVVFGTNTGNNVWDELRLSFDGIGRKNYGLMATGIILCFNTTLPQGLKRYG